jgi:dTDP-4-dehydrorhamnose 3,5-epimerase|tara:strand:- start:1460 stop:1987 length:528 start_codon:yes stop_codon:yes gene_type:complete
MRFGLDIKTSEIFPDIRLFQPKPFCDFRGDIWTLWERENVLPEGLEFTLCKFAKSKENVLRGMHGDFKTWKYMSCPHGEVEFVIADVREGSDTYLRWEKYTLNDENHIGVLVPPGFVNGHLCVSDECLYYYMMSYEGGYIEPHEQVHLYWDDERLNIDWKIKNPILAKRDKRSTT